MKKYASYIISGMFICMLISMQSRAEINTSVTYALNNEIPISISAAHLVEAPLLVCETGGDPDQCCPYWEVTITTSIDWVVVGPIPIPVISKDKDCKTGGKFKCRSSGCTDG